MGKSRKGMLQFGTEVVANKEGTIVGLLGASPGASTCVSIALDTLEKGFSTNRSDKAQFNRWVPQIQKMVPTWEPNSKNEIAVAKIDGIYQQTAAVLTMSVKSGHQSEMNRVELRCRTVGASGFVILS